MYLPNLGLSAGALVVLCVDNRAMYGRSQRFVLKFVAALATLALVLVYLLGR